MEDNTNNNVQEIKGKRTKESIRKAVEGEITEAKLKELKGKLKQMVTDLNAAKAVVRAKEAEIQALFEDNSELIPE